MPCVVGVVGILYVVGVRCNGSRHRTRRGRLFCVSGHVVRAVMIMMFMFIEPCWLRAFRLNDVLMVIVLRVIHSRPPSSRCGFKSILIVVSDARATKRILAHPKTRQTI